MRNYIIFTYIFVFNGSIHANMSLLRNYLMINNRLSKFPSWHKYTMFSFNLQSIRTDFGLIQHNLIHFIFYPTFKVISICKKAHIFLFFIFNIGILILLCNIG